MLKDTKISLDFRSIVKALFVFSIASSSTALDLENVYINGFISQGYLKSSANNYLGDTKDGSWEFNEAAVSFKFLVQDNLTAGMQLISRDFGDSGNNDLNVDWAFLDYRYNDMLGIRAGKVKKPAGLYNTTRDADAFRTSVLLPQGIYAENSRDINIAVQGLSLYGYLDASSAGSIEYTVYYGNQPLDENDPLVKQLKQSVYGIALGGEADYNESFGGQFIWNTPIEGLRFAESISQGNIEITGNNSIYAFAPTAVEGQLKIPMYFIHSVEYLTEKYSISAEYQKQTLELYDAPIALLTGGGALAIETETYYLQFNYFINSQWSAGVYHSWSHDAGDDVDESAPENKTNDLALSLKYNVTDSWIIKAELHLIDGFSSASLDDSGVFEDKWQMLALKTSISF